MRTNDDMNPAVFSKSALCVWTINYNTDELGSYICDVTAHSADEVWDDFYLSNRWILSGGPFRDEVRISRK